ncbi:hypothetical protein [Ruegeria sp.]|uniref:hypothetical protein n=1 Tax=Ruegeria sp. TaxID=1879320 RepID=UPI003B5BDCF8
MDPEEDIQKILDSISPEAKAWSDSMYMSALITGAEGLEGEELRGYIRILVQLSYDEAAGAA